MEARAADEANRTGSAQIVTAVLEALRTVASIRERTDGPSF
jgi:hypothetical protein